MLKIKLITIGKLKEKYLKDACAEYIKRLNGLCKFEINEIDESRLPDKPSVTQTKKCLDEEGKKILALVPKGAYVVSMCIEGKQLSSEQTASLINNVALNGNSTVCFIIGSSFGLSDEVKQSTSLKLSMSKMTFPHQLARVMLLEQIYRAFQINMNTKYHK